MAAIGLLAGLALIAGLIAGSGSNGFPFLPADETDGRPAAGGPGGGAAAVVAPGNELPRGLLAGQRIVAGFEGTSVPAALGEAIRRGRIGGVILFADNLGSRAAIRSLTARLQQIRRPPALRDYPLAIMTDQEGGLVKRLSGAPEASAATIGRRGPAYSRRQGRRTGRNLADAGINIDLAPVLDVARPGGDIAETYRGFGDTADRVERTAVPFAQGLQSTGTAAAAQHFPGLGSASLSTDEAAYRIELPKREIRRIDQRPYDAFIDSGGKLVMVSNAIYPAFGPNPAAFEQAIVTGELRRRLGFRGVAITDALGTVAARSYGGPERVAVAAARAGSDLLLFPDYGEALSAERALAERFRSGRLERKAFRRSVSRILRLRSGLRR